MNRTACPGQDTRYWRPDDIFSITCASCGAGVEFFKDEASRKCPGCGARVRNPRLSAGCAQWCARARECLGYEPDRAEPQGAPPSIADVIIEVIANEFGDGTAAARAGEAAAKAREVLARGGADPAVVLPAAMLAAAGRILGAAAARRIMGEAGVGAAAREEACRIIEAMAAGASIDTPEFRAVSESYAISPTDT